MLDRPSRRGRGHALRRGHRRRHPRVEGLRARLVGGRQRLDAGRARGGSRRGVPPAHPPVAHRGRSSPRRPSSTTSPGSTGWMRSPTRRRELLRARRGGRADADAAGRREGAEPGPPSEDSAAGGHPRPAGALPPAPRAASARSSRPWPCDIVGFTAMSAAADPEDVDRLLADYQTRARGGDRVARRHRGAVHRRRGGRRVRRAGRPRGRRRARRARRPSPRGGDDRAGGIRRDAAAGADRHRHRRGTGAPRRRSRLGPRHPDRRRRHRGCAAADCRSARRRPRRVAHPRPHGADHRLPDTGAGRWRRREPRRPPPSSPRRRSRTQASSIDLSSPLWSAARSSSPTCRRCSARPCPRRRRSSPFSSASPASARAGWCRSSVRLVDARARDGHLAPGLLPALR